jgi:hypothetical protein
MTIYDDMVKYTLLLYHYLSRYVIHITNQENIYHNISIIIISI